MMELARRQKLFLAEALWTFYLPKFDALRQLQEAKAIGDIKSVYTDYGEHFAHDHRIFDPKLAGGPLLDLGIYAVALLTEVFGIPERVVGLGQPDPLAQWGRSPVLSLEKNRTMTGTEATALRHCLIIAAAGASMMSSRVWIVTAKRNRKRQN